MFRLLFFVRAGDAGELRGYRLCCGDADADADADAFKRLWLSSKSRKRLMIFSRVVKACVCNATDGGFVSLDGN